MNQGLEYFHQLKKSGKPVIAIDPIRSETIEFFGDNAPGSHRIWAPTWH